MKVTLLLNPRDGKKRALTVQDSARVIAKELGVSLDIQVITAPGEGTTLSRKAVEMGSDRVISVGGVRSGKSSTNSFSGLLRTQNGSLTT